jgi:type III secretion system IpaD/SipD/SspD family effector
MTAINTHSHLQTVRTAEAISVPNQTEHLDKKGPVPAHPVVADQAQQRLDKLNRLHSDYEAGVKASLQAAAGSLPNFDEPKAMRAQILLELQRFHEFEYPLLASTASHPGVPDRSKSALDVGSTHASPPGFFDDLQDLIGLIGDEYLAVYEHLIQRYSAMFKDFNELFMAKMGEWVKGVNDGKEVELDLREMRDAVYDVFYRYNRVPDSVLYPVPVNGAVPSGTLADAQKWAQAMGLPASQVVAGPPPYVKMDNGPLYTIVRSLEALGSGDTIKIDSAKFQAWQTGMNTQESEMKNQLQLFTSKYSSANSYHDNFNKILSSQLSQYAEMLKAYLG